MVGSCTATELLLLLLQAVPIRVRSTEQRCAGRVLDKGYVELDSNNLFIVLYPFASFVSIRVDVVGSDKYATEISIIPSMWMITVYEVKFYLSHCAEKVPITLDMFKRSRWEAVRFLASCSAEINCTASFQEEIVIALQGLLASSLMRLLI
jgi:hypothetical protein